jgi:PAS domain S-box-containing protein
MFTAFRKDRTWAGIIIVLAAATLLANLWGLLNAITVVIPHLLYLPIIIAAYRFPRRGVVFSLAVASLYLLMVYVFAHDDPGALVTGAARFVVFIAIGWVVSYLSLSLQEREERFRGLFDHAEAGAALVRKQGDEFIIEEANFRLAQVLATRPDDLVGAALNPFWPDAADRDRFFSEADIQGACYAHESRLTDTGSLPVEVLVSAGKVGPDRYVLTIIDITDMKLAMEALDNTNHELHFLSSVTRDDIMKQVSELAGIIDEGRNGGMQPEMPGVLARIEAVTRVMRRRLELTRIYQNLGAERPKWQDVQSGILHEASQLALPGIVIRSWVERLEVYADGLLPYVFHNLISNTTRHGGHASEIVVTYCRVSDGLDIIYEDNGTGIPDPDKETIFQYNVGTHSGLGLFIDRQILGVTGITIKETGRYGKGARFEIHVPQEKYRIV